MKKLLTPLATLFALLLGGCGMTIIPGSGKVIQETRAVSGFDRVEFSAPGELVITQDGSESLTIAADDNLMQYLQARVTNGTLRLEVNPSTASLRPSTPIVYTLSVKNLKSLSLNGTGNIRMENLETGAFALNLNGSGNITLNTLATADFTYNLNGSGDLIMQSVTAAKINQNLNGSGNVNLGTVQADRLVTIINGSSDFTASGRVPDQSLNVNGAGGYDAAGIESETVSINILGSGDVALWVTKSLNVTISGSGEITYRGSPAIRKNIIGSGNLIPKE